MILELPLSYLVPGKPLPTDEESARDVEAILDQHVMGRKVIHSLGGMPLRVPLLEGSDEDLSIPRYLRDRAAAIELTTRAPFLFLWRDVEGQFGGLDWYQAKMVVSDDPSFLAYQPDLPRALSQAALILAAVRAQEQDNFRPIVLDPGLQEGP